MTVAALFVARGGVYFGLPDVDPWDEARDARLYAGPHPVVAHPPCQRWSTLGCCRPGGRARVGQDGGCFEAALSSVRRWGGVLEHPAETFAWRYFGLPRPLSRGWCADVFGGWSCRVDQGHYGHRAPKGTWLYACGVELPPLRWGRSDARGRVAFMGGDGMRRRATPIPFRDLLLSIARTARPSVRAA